MRFCALIAILLTVQVRGQLVEVTGGLTRNYFGKDYNSGWSVEKPIVAKGDYVGARVAIQSDKFQFSFGVSRQTTILNADIASEGAIETAPPIATTFGARLEGEPYGYTGHFRHSFESFRADIGTDYILFKRGRLTLLTGMSIGAKLQTFSRISEDHGNRKYTGTRYIQHGSGSTTGHWSTDEYSEYLSQLDWAIEERSKVLFDVALRTQIVFQVYKRIHVHALTEFFPLQGSEITVGKCDYRYQWRAGGGLIVDLGKKADLE